jgi:hypothetical protein
LDVYLVFDDSGQQFVPIGMPTTCWNSVPSKETNMLWMRNSSILITCSSSSMLYLFEFCLKIVE